MSFSGTPITIWVRNGRDMMLVEELSYVDQQGKVWTAKTNVPYDGASIPRFLWRAIGSPFTGHYRRAALLHDSYYADHRGETRKDVDKMFYQAMVEDGVARIKAQSMYYAVRWFGPRW